MSEEKDLIQLLPSNIEDINIPLNGTRASGTVYWGNGVNFSMTVNWSTSPNVGGGYTNVSVSMYIKNGSVQGTCRDGSHITIDGNTSNFNGKYLNYPGATDSITIHSHSVNIYHSSAKSITISGAWVWNGYIWIGGVYSGTFNTVSGSSSLSLSAIATPPGTPSSVSLTGRFDNGMTTHASWGGVSGATGYDIERRFWKYPENSYSGWNSVENNRNSTSVTIGHSAVTHHAQQVRVRARNSAGVSGWRESGWVYHDGINVYTNGSGSKTYGKVRVWNGSAWVQGYVNVWNGSAWVTTK